ncbi:MAG: PDZ domain-containing protein [Acidobacteria bacterium]|nr:PDZ domain-containing protein [Acidobacteriota bacterium]
MTPRTRVLVALVSTGVIGYVAVGSLLGRVLGDTTYGQLAVFNEVVRLVMDAYVEPVDLDRTMNAAQRGLAEALDGDSAYLDPDDFAAYQKPPKDSDADVGLVLTRRFSFLMVVSTRPGSPAEKAGLRVGDILKTIDGQHSRQIGLPVGERLLRGAPGSVVKLMVLRAGSEPLDFSVVRERLAPVAPSGRMLPDGVGYLKLAEFPARAADEARGEIEGLRRAGARGLVLDLRGSAWGPLSEGVKVASLFLKSGVVAKVTGRRTSEQVFNADASRAAWDLPVAVLVDRATAGAAEIVAAALLESGGSPVVGERTFGRAPLQKAVPLPEGGLVLTVAKYVSPKGNAIHGRGVEPTVPVAAPDEAKEGSDPILEKALEVLKAGAQKAA